MKNYFDLEALAFKAITDEHFVDDIDMVVIFRATELRRPGFANAVNEMLTYIGPMPTALRQQVEDAPEIASIADAIEGNRMGTQADAEVALAMSEAMIPPEVRRFFEDM